MAQLLAAISHELRTPLTAVLGFCDLMGREVFGPVGDPRYSAYLRHIADGGAALLKSTEDTLALTALLAERTESVGAPSQVRLRPLIDEAVAIHAAHASCRRVSVGIEVSDAPTARIDNWTCRQVLANLIGEAVERTADGGCVQIVVHCVGDIVQLRLMADPAGGPLDDAPLASFGVSIARALLELAGAELNVVRDRGTGAWQATVTFEAIVQADLFS